MFDFFLKFFKSKRKEEGDNPSSEPQVSSEQVDEGIENDVYLDCKNMLCPKPIFEISMKVRSMEKGQVLKVVCKDIAFKADVQAWSKRTGNELLKLDGGDGLTTAFIKIKP